MQTLSLFIVFHENGEQTWLIVYFPVSITIISPPTHLPCQAIMYLNSNRSITSLDKDSQYVVVTNHERMGACESLR